MYHVIKKISVTTTTYHHNSMSDQIYMQNQYPPCLSMSVHHQTQFQQHYHLKCNTRHSSWTSVVQQPFIEMKRTRCFSVYLNPFSGNTLQIANRFWSALYHTCTLSSGNLTCIPTWTIKQEHQQQKSGRRSAEKEELIIDCQSASTEAVSFLQYIRNTPVLWGPVQTRVTVRIPLCTIFLLPPFKNARPIFSFAHMQYLWSSSLDTIITYTIPNKYSYLGIFHVWFS
jgi:hypothetical protein